MKQFDIKNLRESDLKLRLVKQNTQEIFYRLIVRPF